MLEQQCAVYVGHLALRESRCALTELIERRELAAEDRRARDHVVMRAVRPAGTGESRLLVDREPLDDPRREVVIRKPERVAAEDALRRAPPAREAVEVEEMRQLVRHE